MFNLIFNVREKELSVFAPAEDRYLILVYTKYGEDAYEGLKS